VAHHAARIFLSFFAYQSEARPVGDARSLPSLARTLRTWAGSALLDSLAARGIDSLSVQRSRISERHLSRYHEEANVAESQTEAMTTKDWALAVSLAANAALLGWVFAKWAGVHTSTAVVCSVVGATTIIILALLNSRKK
jgi:hypothetical protein